MDYCVGHYENSEIAQIILETYEEEDIKKLTGSRDGNGDTALHIAARFGSFECIGLLLGWISKYWICNSIKFQSDPFEWINFIFNPLKSCW